jgi:hypothetical protein
MNLFSRNAIVGFSTLILVIIYAVSGGGDWDDYYNTGSNFAPEAFVDKSYRPLFLSGNMFYGENGYDNEHTSRFNDVIVKDWKTYLGNAMSEKDIHYFMISDSAATDFKLISKAIKTKKTPASWKGRLEVTDIKVINFFTFLATAATVDQYSLTALSWDYDSNQEASKPKLPYKDVKYIENTYNNFKDPFLKNRYWFLTMKANFYSEDRNNTLLFFNKTKTLVPKNTLFYRGMSYVAGVLYKNKDYAKSNFLYSVVFDNCPELRIVTAYSFHPQEEKDFASSLDLAKTNQQKAALWALYGYYADPIEAMGKMYELDPKSQHMEYLLTRAINIEEGKISQLPFETSSNYKKMLKDSLNKKTYGLISKIAQNGNTLKPYLWNTAAGYFEIFNGDHAKAKQYFTATEKTMPQTTLAKNQLRLFYLINNIAETTKMNSKSEKVLLDEMTWLINLPKNEGESSAFRYQNAITWSRNYVSKLYKQQNDPVMEELFVRKQDFYLNPTYLESMKSFFAKSNKSPWEKLAKSMYSITEDDINDFQAVNYTYKNELEKAVFYMEKKKNHFVLLGNPFNGNIQDCHDCDHAAYQKRKFTELDFLKTMQEMQINIKNGVEVYNNNLLLGNAFYNISYYGNARLFYEGNTIVGQYGNYIAEHYQGLLFSNSVAKTYYEKAFAAAQNKEQKAKCLYMLSKIERNAFYESKAYADQEGDSRKDFMAFDGFKKLNKEYADTKYYNEVINECGYFRTYVGQ